MTRRRSGEERRQEIVAKAADLFDRDGYYTTNMTTVARAAGIEKPTLYHYFSGKDAILFAIHEEFIDPLIAKQEARVGSGMSAAETLRAIVGDILSHLDSHRGHVRVFFEYQRELSPVERTSIGEKRDHYAALVRAELERGVAAGELRPIDPWLATLALFGVCNWAYQWYRPDGPLSSGELADAFWDILFGGLDARSPVVPLQLRAIGGASS
jgi:TetR/AcrR family transcriptional regulator, cholesterol catabolism regulator